MYLLKPPSTKSMMMKRVKQDSPSRSCLLFSRVVRFILFLLSCSSFTNSLVTATDTIRPNDDLLRDNNTLLSASGIFELGFFEYGDSGTHYLGIWLAVDKTRRALWFSRENPIFDSSGTLQIRSDGNLILMDRRQVPMIVNSGTLAKDPNTSATVLDSGNLVLKQADNIIWQSFDYPTDTFLPGMRIGWFGLNTDQSKFLVSWLTLDNPARGSFTLGVLNGSTNLSVWIGNSVHMDIGFWDIKDSSFRFIFENNSYSSKNYKFSYISNENETYFTFSTVKDSAFTWFVMSSSGELEEYTMVNETISYVSHPLCADSEGGNTGQCLTSIPSTCPNGSNFSGIEGTILSSIGAVSVNLGFNECQSMCKSNCSCTAFAVLENDPNGCQFYFTNTKDLLSSIKKGNGEVYVRVGDSGESGDHQKRRLWLIIAGIVMTLLAMILVSSYGYIRWKKRRKGEMQAMNGSEGRNRLSEVRLLQLGTKASTIRDAQFMDKHKLSGNEDGDLPFFSILSIEIATNGFAIANKLGEGGYGPVYKGRFANGQEIAVKRLSKVSRQGTEEFKTEVTLISRVQHRNLVRLIGCCIEAEESILVYEYMPNNSLDSFIFDSSKKELLDWPKRVKIIEGIAQGILYLHRYSRLKIIHRDLKTSNILLDINMNPRISDFGLARIFAENETQAKTNRAAGTCGYMSPEYAMDGIFSEKSDVFSFGVILLEIVSGKKNIAFYEADHSMNLLSSAWSMWKEGKAMEFVDQTVAKSCSEGGVMRCVQLGLLCVQERAIYRPAMSEVVSMLNSQTLDIIPVPREPAFLFLQSTESDSSSRKQRDDSVNEMSVSQVYAR